MDWGKLSVMFLEEEVLKGVIDNNRLESKGDLMEVLENIAKRSKTAKLWNVNQTSVHDHELCPSRAGGGLAVASSGMQANAFLFLFRQSCALCKVWDVLP